MENSNRFAALIGQEVVIDEDNGVVEFFAWTPADVVFGSGQKRKKTHKITIKIKEIEKLQEEDQTT